MVKTLNKSTMVVLAALCAGALVTACGSADETEANAEANEDFGSIGLNVEISDGVFVNEVFFSITGNDIIPIEGTIPVEELGSTVSALIGGIPAGLGYEIVLTAVATDGSADCLGNAMFDVVAGQTTEVDLILDCTPVVDDGQVDIDGQFNTCPDIVQLSAFPLEVEVGDDILLAVAAVDADEDMISYLWSAAPTGGSFSADDEQETTYTCGAAGDFTITVVAADERCDDTAVIDVVCAPAGVCGNDIVETGEQCDDGNLDAGDGCSPTCRDEVCGNQIVDPGEECDAGVNGSATCRGTTPADGGDPCTIILPAGCGNDQLDMGEECDDGNTDVGDGCNNLCQVEECGNNRIDAIVGSVPLAFEECDDGNLNNGDGCSDTCTVELDACTQCTIDDPAADGGLERFNACDTALCQDLLTCINTTRCADVASIDCYCGPGVSPFSCLIPGNQQGECIPEIQAAALTSDPQAIAERFINPEFALGDAFRIIEYQRVNCPIECGF